MKQFKNKWEFYSKYSCYSGSSTQTDHVFIKKEVGTIQIHTNLSDASEEIIISTSELTDKATGMIFILLGRWEIQLDVQTVIKNH